VFKRNSRPQPEVDAEGIVISVPIGGSTEREHLDAIFANSPAVELDQAGGHVVGDNTKQDPNERHIEESARGMGMRYDAVGRSVTLPVGDDPHPNERLFRLSETLLVGLVGLRAAMQTPEPTRYERARILAQHGRLDAVEVQHLRWLADAAEPFELVKPATASLTGDQARTLVAVIDEMPQHGRQGLPTTKVWQ
jgi:hypothetical protein